MPIPLTRSWSDTAIAAATPAQAYRLSLIDSIAGDVVLNSPQQGAGAFVANSYGAGITSDATAKFLPRLGGYLTEVNGT